MSVQVRGVSNLIGEVEANTLAQRVVAFPPNVGSNGAYGLSASTGAITTVAAGTATAGHIFSCRWSHATKVAYVTALRVKWMTIAGFTAAQEVGLQAFVARGFTVAQTGGTAVTLTGNSMKKDSTHGTTTFADIRVATTGALTAGTHTLDAQPVAEGGFSELAAGAAVPKGFFELSLPGMNPQRYPLILRQDTGIIVRNTILMGAGGTARVSVQMEWLELDSWP